MSVLLAVDGSESSAHAVAHLIADLGRWRERPAVHLLHVHPPIPVGRAGEFIGHDSLERYYREESLAQLAEAERLLAAAGVPYVRHIHVGSPAELIVRVAGELGCDRIVLGNGGRGALADAVLGSVAHRVLRLASCPVLLVK
ncbi:MAG: universal stress protein [Rhodocyclaceae bacterium]|nr:universal stress protein [Rhodocyclaceae bacterium]